MEFKKLRIELKKEYDNITNEAIAGLEKPTDHLKNKDELLEWCVRWTLGRRTPYKGDYEEQKNKCIIALRRKYNKEYLRELDYLNSVENAGEFKEFHITIEWFKSNMGNQAEASDNYGNESGRTGGYGYDKESTACARILNQHKDILKMMFAVKDKDTKQSNHDVLGYGSGYELLPKFEGGVGISSHKTILARLGLAMETVSSTKRTDTFRIHKVTKAYLKAKYLI